LIGAGRMTATARADIGARCWSPTEKRGSRVCVQMCDDVRPSDDDLDWEFVFDSRLGHPTGTSEEPMAKKSQKSKRRCDELPILHPDAAGIDVGASELFVAVSADRDPEPVRSFPTFTRDLNALADWLQRCGIRSVAMESTSVYWIPVSQGILVAPLKDTLVVRFLGAEQGFQVVPAENR
jgi:hypothetical protein